MCKLEPSAFVNFGTGTRIPCTGNCELALAWGQKLQPSEVDASHCKSMEIQAKHGCKKVQVGMQLLEL